MRYEQLIEEFNKDQHVSAIIEAGHYYMDSRFSPLGDQDFILAEKGVEVAVALKRGVSVPTSTWWFVDELHADDQGVPEGLERFRQVRERYKDNGFDPDHIIYESDEILLTSALNLIDRISAQYILRMRKYMSLLRPSVIENGVVIKPSESPYRLCGRNKRKEYINPTCCLIDAALYEKKWDYMGREGVCVTILPEVYRPQQETTRTILERASLSVAIMNAYFDNTGSITSVERNY